MSGFSSSPPYEDEFDAMAAGGKQPPAGGGGGGRDPQGVDAQKEAVLKQILEPAARMRLNNVRMVKPELAGAVENYLVGMGAQGRLQAPITDDQLKQILLSAQQPKRDFKINRV